MATDHNAGNDAVHYTHEGMTLRYVGQPKPQALSGIYAGEPPVERVSPVPYPPFHIGLNDVHRLLYPPPPNGSTILSAEMELTESAVSGEGATLVYRHAAQRLTAVIRYEFVPGCAVIRQTTTIRNEGDQPRTVNYLTAALLNGIGTGGLGSWQQRDRFILHYAHQTWHGEGQWRQSGLEELGLYHHSPHPPVNTIRFSSYGSFSTSKYLPMIVLEDRETEQVWYMQAETSAAWNMEIGYRGSWNGVDGCLYMQADGGSERFGNWTKELLPGESYTSIPVAFGCAQGDFNDAVKQLTLYRRFRLKAANAWEGEFPLVYNDFMNGIWGQPTRERLEPLISSAAKAGAELFCIDAGWFMENRDDAPQELGNWEAVDERFGEGGLQGILNDIRDAGMLPGIWLEIEMCHIHSRLHEKPDEWFVRYEGRRIGGPDRVFLDFACEEVKSYFHAIIDRLTAMGVRYIKNDYNDYMPHAHSRDGRSRDGVREAMNAFYAFIDEVRARHPELILENCGSGAMREDYAVLSHFHVQSTSDQEFYDRYPSILMGTEAAVLPEQAGIWSYPYPLMFLEQKHPERLLEPAYQEEMKDGEQTIFNLVNGMCGNMVLAGHLYAADDYNMALIQSGTARYKREREHIRRSVPVYPTGLARLGDRHDWLSFGLLDEERGRMLLAVWKLNSPEETFEIPLGKWYSVISEAKLIYPEQPAGTDYALYRHACKLAVRMNGTNRARLFEIKGSIR